MSNQERTCAKCARVLSSDQFHRNHSKASGYESYCKDCRRARRAKYHEANRDRTLEQIKEYRDAHKPITRAYRADLANRTRPLASNHGLEWTGPELEIAIREDLTVVEIALMLGRTHAAVEGARTAARKKPRERFLSGGEADL